ncbi:GNAT family N-acetyltransferase [Oscillospiraceae bacterium OttesenSCG-928-F05]|nr:GNAT family N-acetyltransferase [Oscillospiraceae bacterium OttesenSCG-928-F05]
MTIRKTTRADLPQVMAIYAAAREFMRETGNASQWGANHPARSLIEADIAAGKSYVCTGAGQMLAVFYFSVERDPTYAVIRDGEWLNDAPYGVVHRIASAGTVRGVGAYCIDWCFEACGNVRIDTHEANLPMQKVLARLGFSRCGTVTLEDGDLRIAYQKCR